MPKACFLLNPDYALGLNYSIARLQRVGKFLDEKLHAVVGDAARASVPEPADHDGLPCLCRRCRRRASVGGWRRRGFGRGAGLLPCEAVKRTFRPFACLLDGGGIVEFPCLDQIGLELFEGLTVTPR